MKRSTIYFSLSALLALSFVLASCAPTATPVKEAPQGSATEASQPAAQAETITVIFPKHEADLSGAFEARIREFEKQSGIKVELIQSDWDSVANRILPAVYDPELDKTLDASTQGLLAFSRKHLK